SGSSGRLARTVAQHHLSISMHSAVAIPAPSSPRSRPMAPLNNDIDENISFFCVSVFTLAERKNRNTNKQRIPCCRNPELVEGQANRRLYVALRKSCQSIVSLDDMICRWLPRNPARDRGAHDA